MQRNLFNITLRLIESEKFLNIKPVIILMKSINLNDYRMYIHPIQRVQNPSQKPHIYAS